MKGGRPLNEIFSHPRYEMPSVFEAGEPVTVRASSNSSDLGNFLAKVESIKESAPQGVRAYKVVDTTDLGDEKVMKVQYYK